MTGKHLRKVIQQLLLMYYVLKNEYISWLHFLSKIQIIKKVILLMILNGEGCHYFAVENMSVLLRGITYGKVIEIFV